VLVQVNSIENWTNVFKDLFDEKYASEPGKRAEAMAKLAGLPKTDYSTFHAAGMAMLFEDLFPGQYQLIAQLATKAEAKVKEAKAAAKGAADRTVELAKTMKAGASAIRLMTAYSNSPDRVNDTPEMKAPFVSHSDTRAAVRHAAWWHRYYPTFG
jgi:hypothetical protein